jgi:hypothetical protein
MISPFANLITTNHHPSSSLPYLDPFSQHLCPNSASEKVHHNAWSSCFEASCISKAIADDRLTSSHDFEWWKHLRSSEQMTVMATYVSDLSTVDSEQIMDQWRQRKPKEKRNLVDEDGWQISSTKKSGIYSTEAERADYEEDEEDNDDDDVEDIIDNSFNLDPEIQNEGANRDFFSMQDNFDDENGPLKYKRKTLRELTNTWIKGDVDFNVNQKFIDFYDKCSNQSLDSLTVKEKTKLVKRWTALLKEDASAKHIRLRNEYNVAAEVVNDYEAEIDAFVLSKADVIGMTTTCAAKYNRYD